MQSNTPTQADSASRDTARVYYLDWLRVLAIVTVFVFHSGRFFDQEEWHVKNPTTYFGVEVWTYFLVGWLMPVIFLISGASIFYALGKGGPFRFAKDRLLRLLVPLMIGACTHIAFQVYLEYRFQHRFSGTFWAFLPRYFHGWREFGGNFAWYGIHLWYLLALLLFSLIFLPLFLWLRKESGRRTLDWLGRLVARPGVVYLLALPGTLMASYLNPEGILTRRDWGGWGLPVYIPFFLAGFLFVSHEGLLLRIKRQRWVSLAAGVILFGALLYIGAAHRDLLYGSSVYRQFYALFSLYSWAMVLAILGFGLQHLTKNTSFLRYANEAVLPFYILHQTVIISVGYLVVRQPIPDLLKFVLISAGSFAIIMLLYECLIRRFNVMRFLFGMRPVRRAARARIPDVKPVTGPGGLPPA